MSKPKEAVAKEPVKVRRAKVLRWLKQDMRVSTPMGDGAFRYMEDRVRAVVTLDKPRQVAIKMDYNEQPTTEVLSARSAYIDVAEIAPLGTEFKPKKIRKQKEKQA